MFAFSVTSVTKQIHQGARGRLYGLNQKIKGWRSGEEDAVRRFRFSKLSKITAERFNAQQQQQQPERKKLCFRLRKLSPVGRLAEKPFRSKTMFDKRGSQSQSELFFYFFNLRDQFNLRQADGHYCANAGLQAVSGKTP